MDVEFLRYKFEDGFSGVITKYGFKTGIRHLQMAYMFVSAVVMGIIRGSLGIAVLAMTDESRYGDTYIRIHKWDRRVQGAILSSFFFGNAIVSLPADLFLKKLGGKFSVAIMLGVNGAFCVAMPTIANRGGWVAVSNAMMFMGMAHAGFSSINLTLLQRWLPPGEKKLFGFIVFGGIQLGIIIGIPVSGVLSQLPLGWELIYYSLAMLSLAVAVVYGILTASTPEQHQAISDKEKEFIRDALSCYTVKVLPKPWKRILKSPQFWAVTAAHMASNALFIFYLTDVPAYLKLLKLPLKDIACFSMVPFLVMWLMYLTTSPTLGWISNLKLVSYILDVTNFRKVINVLGAIGIIIGLTVLSNMPANWMASAVLILIISFGLLGFQYSGFLSSYSDMTENHAGSVMMLGCAISNIFGATMPFLTALIIADDVMSIRRWHVVLVLLACMYAVCNLVYTTFGSNDRQDWDRYGVTKNYHHYNGPIDANQVQLEEFNGTNFVSEKYENDTAL